MKSDTVSGRSFLEYGSSRLRALCEGLRVDEGRTREALSVFACLLEGWGDAPIGDAPRWTSDITDDHSPYEFSVAMDGGEVELRMLAEAQSERTDLGTSWAAGRALSERLAARFGVSLERLAAVEPLFAPTDPAARFSVWHAATLRAGAPAEFKIYLNPQARGPHAAPGVVASALARLGFRGAAAPSTGRGLDELKYFSLDLSRRPDARVKLYSAHHNADAAAIESALGAARFRVAGEAGDFCRHMACGDGPYTQRPLQTCLAYAAGHDGPRMATVHFPVRAYAPNDAVACERIARYLAPTSAALYRAAIERFAGRPLESGVGMQTYASLRQQPGGARVTVYLSPEIYSVASPRARALPGAPARSAKGPRPSPAERVLP